MDWKDIKYFKPEEFDSPDFPGSGQSNMSLDFVEILDRIRETVGFPLKITSGFRTPGHNKLVKGKDNSAHLRGFAADIAVNNSSERFAIIRAAILLGITRIEDAPAHVHIDNDASLPQNVMIFLAHY